MPFFRALSGDRATLPATVLELLEQPALLLDIQGNVLQANALAQSDLPGLEEGRPLTTALRHPLLQEALQRLYSGESHIEMVEVDMRKPLPRRLRARMAVLPAAAEDTAPQHDSTILLLLKDVSEEEKLSRSRMAFVASASHELRTPLAAILGIAETLLGPARDDANAREEFLQHLLKQARRMQHLVNDMLSLARIEQEEHAPPTGIVDINPIARSVAESLREKARAAGVVLELRLEEPQALVRGDAMQLEQILLNLLENALAYGADGGRVRLRVRQRISKRGVRYVAITVRDWGRGIEKKHIPHLTERFYRVDKQVSRNRGGTGLGLAIVKHLVRRHRGRLKIRSRPGKGARFIIRLPAAQQDAGKEQTE